MTEHKAKCIKCGIFVFGKTDHEASMNLLEHFREEHPTGTETVNVVIGDVKNES